MTRRLRFALTMIAMMIATGCASAPSDGEQGRNTNGKPSVFKRLADATKPLRESVRWLTETKDPYVPPRWDWASAIPKGAIRSEMIQPVVAGDAVAYFVPELRREAVVLASTNQHGPLFEITNIGGAKVSNCNDLYVAVDEAIDKAEPVQVDFTRAGSRPNDPGAAAIVEGRALVALCQAVAPEHAVTRIALDGNPWLVIRHGGIRCKLTARVERRYGLLQVVLSLVNCWQPQATLPVEVRAYCDDQPLRCLAVAETLELLYGEPEQNTEEAQEGGCSFAAVSGRDDYLIPTNYHRLRQAMDEGLQGSAAPAPLPALVGVPGEVYPESAVLGDARALTGCLLQRQVFQPGDSEQTGWIIFAGAPLKDGGTVIVEVDLGAGKQQFSFAVPPS